MDTDHRSSQAPASHGRDEYARPLGARSPAPADAGRPAVGPARSAVDLSGGADAVLAAEETDLWMIAAIEGSPELWEATTAGIWDDVVTWVAPPEDDWVLAGGASADTRSPVP